MNLGNFQRLAYRILALFVVIGAMSFAVKPQSVSGSIANGTVRRGTTARGTLVLTIPKELHVNSNRPGSEYLIPTAVRIFGRNVIVSRVRYPRGRDRKFQFTEKLLNVYEGTVFFPFRVNIPRNYRGSFVRVFAEVEFQACTEEVCYPPRKEKLKVTAKVR